MEDPSSHVNMCNNVYQGQLEKNEKVEKEMAKIRARKA